MFIVDKKLVTLLVGLSLALLLGGCGNSASFGGKESQKGKKSKSGSKSGAVASEYEGPRPEGIPEGEPSGEDLLKDDGGEKPYTEDINNDKVEKVGETGGEKVVAVTSMGVISPSGQLIVPNTIFRWTSDDGRQIVSSIVKEDCKTQASQCGGVTGLGSSTFAFRDKVLNFYDGTGEDALEKVGMLGRVINVCHPTIPYSSTSAKELYKEISGSPYSNSCSAKEKIVGVVKEYPGSRPVYLWSKGGGIFAFSLSDTSPEISDSTGYTIQNNGEAYLYAPPIPPN